MSNKRLKLSYEGDVAILEMTHDKNEFTHEFLDDLNEALDQVLSEPSVVALVTYGGTGKHYSNGLNLMEIAAAGVQSSILFSRKFCNLMARLTTFPMPTIAAINGHAFAGGGVLALSHDYRVMNSERGWLCLPEVNIGLLFTKTLMEIITSKIPVGKSQRDMIVMGKKLTGEEGVKSGVVDRVAPSSQVLIEAVSLARSLVTSGAYGRETMGDMKKDLYSNVVATLGDEKFNFMSQDVLKGKL